MKRIVIIGSSGLGKEVYFVIKEINKLNKTWGFLGFIDKQNVGKEIIDGYKVIGDDEFAVNEFKGISIAIAIGFPHIRKKVYEFYKKFKVFDFPNLICPGVIGDFENIKMGEANIITANSVLTTGIEIGHCNLINMSAIIAHDVKIHDFCVINPNANISGKVTLEDNCLIGASSVIHQGVKLGGGTTLGMGAVLTRDTVEKATYMGNPARKIL